MPTPKQIFLWDERIHKFIPQQETDEALLTASQRPVYKKIFVPPPPAVLLVVEREGIESNDEERAGLYL